MEFNIELPIVELPIAPDIVASATDISVLPIALSMVLMAPDKLLGLIVYKPAIVPSTEVLPIAVAIALLIAINSALRSVDPAVLLPSSSIPA